MDNRPFVVIDEDNLNGVSQEDWSRTVNGMLAKRFLDGVTISSRQIKINQTSRKELTFSIYTKWLRESDPQTYADKYRTLNNSDEIILAYKEYINEGLKHSRKDNIVGFARGSVQLRVGTNDYEATVIIGNTGANEMLLYDVIDIKATKIKSRQAASRPNITSNRKDLPVSDNSISNEGTKSNKKFSLKYNVENTYFVVIEEDILEGVQSGEWVKTVKKALAKNS